MLCLVVVAHLHRAGRRDQSSVPPFGPVLEDEAGVAQLADPGVDGHAFAQIQRRLELATGLGQDEADAGGVAWDKPQLAQIMGARLLQVGEIDGIVDVSQRVQVTPAYLQRSREAKEFVGNQSSTKRASPVVRSRMQKERPCPRPSPSAPGLMTRVRPTV